MITPKLLLKLLPSYLLMIGIFTWPLVSARIDSIQAQKGNQAYLESVQTPTEPTKSGIPVELEIPRLGLKLAIKNGGYDQQQGNWILGWNDAYFAQETNPVNNKTGHTLIYGHDVPAVFTPTEKLVMGDQLIITTDNGLRLEYHFTGSQEIKPTDTSILSKQSKEPELTLLTCEGAFNQSRRLMNFKYLRSL